MKEKLVTILGLKPIAPATSVSDDQVITAVADLAKAAATRGETDSREKAIAEKIASSGGALNREQAIMALDHQAKADADRKAAKK